MGFLLVELDAEEASQVLQGLFFISEDVVPVDLLHVVVLFAYTTEDYFRVALEVLAEGVVVGALDDVDELAHGSVTADGGG